MKAPTADTEAPGAHLTGTARAWIMVSLLIAILPLQLDALVTATAVPTVVGDLGGFKQIAWVSTVYLLTMAVGTLVAGRLGDMFGRKTFHLLALTLFFAGSAWTGLSLDMADFIAARALQGLGAGMAITTVLSIVPDIAPAHLRSRYQGLLGVMAPISMIAGPIIGGVLTDHLGWRWIFLLNLPVIAIAITVAAVFLRLPRRQVSGPIDLTGMVLASIGACGAVLAVTWAGLHGWSSPPVWLAGLVGVLAFAGLVPAELRAAHPVLPVRQLSKRTLVMCIVIMFCGAGAVLMAVANFVPIFQQWTQHQSASSSGLLLLPMLLPAIVMVVACGQYLTKADRFRETLIAGAALLALGCGLLATMTVRSPVWLTACFLAVAGAGVGMLMKTPLVLLQNNVPPDHVGAATGTATYFRMLGGALGVGVLGTLFSSTAQRALQAAPRAGVDASVLSTHTPDDAAGLSAQAQQAVAEAVASGMSALFWVTLVLSAIAVVAAVAVPRGVRTPTT